jgi:hypothetical protein
MLSELTAPPKCGTTSMRADYSLIGTARRRSGLRLDRLSDLIPYALETDWPVEAGGFKPLHLRIEFAKTLRSGREYSNCASRLKLSCRTLSPKTVSGHDRQLRI